jgi:polar amino acid transport system substrate-binding protein
VQIRFLVFWLGVWLTCIAGQASCASVTLCADVWCPYNCVPGSTHPGFAVEIAQEVFGAAGYQVDYQLSSWARCIEDTRAGRFSGIIGAITKDAPDFIFPTQPIGISTDTYAVRKGDHFHFTGAQSLDGRVLGVVRGYSYTNEIGAYIAAHGNDGSRIEFISGDDAVAKNLAKLLAGRVDVVLDDGNVLRHAIATLGLEGQVRLDDGPDTAPVYIAFSPATPQGKVLSRLLDQGIAALRSRGRLGQILASYHVSNGS